jgi:predicted nicotinamide N-methyase
MEREETEERDQLRKDSLKPLATAQQKVFNELEAAEKLLPSLPHP